MTDYRFKITKTGQVIFKNGATWDDVPQVTGNDIRALRRELGLTQEVLAANIEVTRERVTQLEAYGDRPIDSPRARVRFLLFKEANVDPAVEWVPEKIVFRISEVSGYLGRHTCGVNKRTGQKHPGGCGKEFWSTNIQRVFCKMCAPYEGIGKSTTTL